MKEHGALSTTFEQQTTDKCDTDDDKLRRSSRIRNKTANVLKLSNNEDNIDDKKSVLSALSKDETITGHHIIREDFCAV
jgi:hypothetical protein